MARFGMVLDLDGTLADTLADIGGAVNHALSGLGLPVHGLDKYRRWVGRGWFNLVRQAVGDHQRYHAELVETSWDYYEQHLTDHTVLYPGMQNVLDTLAARGVPMAILTNKPHHLAGAIVENLGCSNYFRTVQGARDDQLRKPFVALTERVISAMALPADRIYMVGDSEVDVETAAEAGMVSVCVPWGFRDRDELIQAGPTHMVDTAAELLALPGIAD